ncbi:MAG TPA: hypothetical protein VFO44_17480 [Steroidobacteraceae bacterium]|nr:hypothetical protein [Steroidobacteraceae bacterium]
MPSADELSRLLEHPAIWRGISSARMEVLPTGFRALDERLPGGGWPRRGLIEILGPRFGIGELSLLLPALAALTRRPLARWCVWAAPAFPRSPGQPPKDSGDYCLLEPFAPALVAHGIALERVLVVRVPASSPRARSSETLWTFEQSLGSGACDVAMAWVGRPPAREIRRLQLAAERGRALGVLFRPLRAASEASHAILRLKLEPATNGLRATLLKSRGGVHGSVELALHASGN